jgi:soluble lytic murein transglycosylase
VKACEAAEANSTKTGALLAAVPEAARADFGYALCRLHWLLAQNDLAAAVKLLAESSGEDLQRQDTDEWWRERRILARRLLDLGDPKTAYRVVSEAAAPANPYYRAEFHFMPGWIALRFLSDPVTALRHFAKVDEGSSDPIVLARAAYCGLPGQFSGPNPSLSHAQLPTLSRSSAKFAARVVLARDVSLVRSPNCDKLSPA